VRDDVVLRGSSGVIDSLEPQILLVRNLCVVVWYIYIYIVALALERLICSSLLFTTFNSEAEACHRLCQQP
jgi:hypothetical protein